MTGAKKEKAEAEAARAEEAAAKEAAEKEAIVMPDGTTVPSSQGAPTGKRKKAGAGKSTKKLLKHLRQIAEVRALGRTRVRPFSGNRRRVEGDSTRAHSTRR